MSESNSGTGYTREEAAYRRVIDELFVRLSLYAADTSSGRALLYHLREEVVERALQDIPADTTYGRMLVGISDYLMKVVRVEKDERGRLQRPPGAPGATVTQLQRE
jgi:hypothetical protein